MTFPFTLQQYRRVETNMVDGRVKGACRAMFLGVSLVYLTDFAGLDGLAVHKHMPNSI